MSDDSVDDNDDDSEQAWHQANNPIRLEKALVADVLEVHPRSSWYLLK